MRDLAKTFRPDPLSKNAFRLYEKFRPEISEEVTGWGISMALDFAGVVNAPGGNPRTAFQARTKLNRKDFDLLADLEGETGGFPIGKDVRIKMAGEGILKKHDNRFIRGCAANRIIYSLVAILREVF